MDDGGWKAGWLLWHWAKAIEKNGKTNKTSGWQQCWWHHWILFMCSKQQVASGESQLDSWATEECKLVLLLAFLFVFAVNPSKTKQCDILQEDMLLSRIGSGIRSEEGHEPQCVWCTSKKWDEVVWGWHDVSVVSLNWIQKACGWLLFCSDLMVESVDTVGCCFCNGRRIVVSQPLKMPTVPRLGGTQSGDVRPKTLTGEDLWHLCWSVAQTMEFSLDPIWSPPAAAGNSWGNRLSKGAAMEKLRNLVPT